MNNRSNAWKGGKHLDVNGYVLVWAPAHPNARTFGYVQEHVKIVTAIIGRPLKAQECVHHVDENKQNNRNNNLVVCQDLAYHNLLHLRARALRQAGNANARICRYCKIWDSPDKITFSKQTQPYHVECNRAYQRKRRKKSPTKREVRQALEELRS